MIRVFLAPVRMASHISLGPILVSFLTQLTPMQEIVAQKAE
jgi:hypothetical protein